ncbi:hypothetical protein PR048_016509 [Dryococelus australis]|uniref:CCHC-type domain-containing protein n=1 Tax=Dryococelus australis TaxID=614101 RepID=A0ABQ9HJX8_9NEOP|nr:hypothetical protein PR048_016509 [Dryococelus australis]
MFNKVMQTEDQPFDNFLTSVINQGKKCELQEQTNSLLCDKIASCRDNQTPTSSHEDRNISNVRGNLHGKIWQRKTLETNRKGAVIIFTVRVLHVWGFPPVKGIPAFGKSFHECGKPGHFAHMCRSPQVTTLTDATLQPEKGQHAHNVDEEEVFLLDTGARCNVITTSIANKCKLKIIQSKTRSLMAFSKDSVPVLGEVPLPVVTDSKMAAVV